MAFAGVLINAGDNRVAAVEFGTFPCSSPSQCMGFQATAGGVAAGLAGTIRSLGVADITGVLQYIGANLYQAPTRQGAARIVLLLTASASQVRYALRTAASHSP